MNYNIYIRKNIHKMYSLALDSCAPSSKPVCCSAEETFSFRLNTPKAFVQAAVEKKAYVKKTAYSSYRSDGCTRRRKDAAVLSKVHGNIVQNIPKSEITELHGEAMRAKSERVGCFNSRKKIHPSQPRNQEA